MKTQRRPIFQVAFLAASTLMLAGATPAHQRQYQLLCKLTGRGGTELASPTICGVEAEPFGLTAGGTAPTLRAGVRLDYGISLAGWVAPAADGKLVLDLNVSLTALDQAAPDGITTEGRSVHTVRSAAPGKPIHLSLGSDMTCDVTVSPVVPPPAR